MKRFNRIQVASLVVGFVGAAALIVSFTSSVNPQPANEQSQSAAKAWLLDSCDVEEIDKVEQQLRAVGAQLEPVFVQAFQNGPDSALVSEVEQAAAKRFDQRQELLKSGITAGLSKEDLDAARNVSREQFVAQAKDDFVNRYKSQALLGLGVVDGPKALEILEQVARDEKSPLKSTAEQALNKLRQYKKDERPQ
jgi:hypothetical protein